jgi:cell fate regulator YaaT (PSP1 superfamily)
MQLPMEIVDADHIFGGERIVFYFMSDGRIDFRELVKRIAQEYQTRIEMRQIGSRDEAKLFGDYETCGQECCCIKFLKALKPVNMRMAKMQKATLDPSKISGYCGRLKCCLRYEDETYTELKKRLPRKGTRVKTPQGLGKVIDGQIITQLIMVEHDDQTKAAFALSEIEILPSGQNFQGKQKTAEEPRKNIPAEDEHEKYEQEQDDSRQKDTDDEESYDQQNTQQADPDQQFNP